MTTLVAEAGTSAVLDPPTPPTPLTAAASALPAEGLLEMVRLVDLRESPLNHRRKFDEGALAELADSIRAHGVLTPAIARPLRTGGYELAAGHRRLRAAKRAGLERIPVIIRPMTDIELLEVLTIENLQRQDVTALEEARGFQALLDAGAGYDARRLAGKVGKSKEYVYARLKLLQLIPAAQAALDQGEMNPGQAILVARLEAEDQAEMLKEMKDALRYRDGGMSVRGLNGRIEQVVRKRAGQQKAEAALAKLREAGEKPVQVSERWTSDIKDVKGRQEWQEASKGAAGAVPAVLVEDYHTNSDRLGQVCYVTLGKPAARTSGNPEPDRWRAEQRRRQAKQQREGAIRRRVLIAILSKVPAVLGAGELRLVGRGLLVEMWHETLRAVARAHGLESARGGDLVKALGAHLDGLHGAELGRFLVELALARATDATHADGRRLTAAATHYGVRPEVIRRHVEAEERAKAKGTGAKGTGAKGTGKRRAAQTSAKASKAGA